MQEPINGKHIHISDCNVCNSTALHGPSCLITIRGYISCALYPEPKFPAGINKARLLICRKPYILTNACELNDNIRQMFNALYSYYFSLKKE